MQAKYGISCLELPLIQHTQGPDSDKLSSVLCGTFSKLCGSLYGIINYGTTITVRCQAVARQIFLFGL
jgi:hypothetical protein